MNKKEKSEKVLKIIGDIKNSSNKDLMLVMDTIQEDFEKERKSGESLIDWLKSIDVAIKNSIAGIENFRKSIDEFKSANPVLTEVAG